VAPPVVLERGVDVEFDNGGRGDGQDAMGVLDTDLLLRRAPGLCPGEGPTNMRDMNTCIAQVTPFFVFESDT
jgi:hypothetical protein